MKKYSSVLACLILVIVVTLSCLISKDNTNNLITDSKGTLAVYLDGELADSFPGIDTKYRFERIECENGGTASFDWVNEKLNVSLSNADSCNVYYNGKFPLIDGDNVTFYSDGELVVHENNTDILFMMLDAYVNSSMNPLSGDFAESFVNNEMYYMFGLLGRQWDALCIYNFGEECSSLEEFIETLDYSGYLNLGYEETLSQIQKLLKHIPVISKITFDEGITTIGDVAFDSFGAIDFEVPNSIVTIKSNAFGQSKLTVDLSDCSNLTTIGNYAFVTYYGDEIIFPTNSSITTIGTNVFAHIEDYKHEIVIPDSVESLGKYAFTFSTIPKVVLPNNYNYTMIEQGTFYNANIGEIIVPDNIISIHSNAFTKLSSTSTIYLAYDKTSYTNENGEAFDFTGLNVVENFIE